MKGVRLWVIAFIFLPWVTACTDRPDVKNAEETSSSTVLAEPLRKNHPSEPTKPLPEAAFPETYPGESGVLPRAFEGAVPQVGHTMAAFEISPESNDCLMCHDPNNGFEDTPFVPDSHLMDGVVSNARYQCNLCHVPQSDTEPLVENGNDRLAVMKEKEGREAK